MCLFHALWERKGCWKLIAVGAAGGVGSGRSTSDQILCLPSVWDRDRGLGASVYMKEEKWSTSSNSILEWLICNTTYCFCSLIILTRPESARPVGAMVSLWPWARQICSFVVMAFQQACEIWEIWEHSVPQTREEGWERHRSGRPTGDMYQTWCWPLLPCGCYFHWYDVCDSFLMP